MKDRCHPVPTADTSLALRIKLTEVPSTRPSPIQSTLAATNSEPPVNDLEQCKMVRSSERSLASVASASTLLLFTPAITPAGKAANKSGEKNVDPFETLGRALSRYHKRIRHVPYIPKIGFTETHEAFLSQADAVVVVICEPEHAKHECLGNQGDFAGAAHEAMDNTSFSGHLPIFLVRCGDSKGNFWPDLTNFDNVMKCSTYDPEMAKQVARKLFEAK